ncbi:MAG: response regulator transcription factor [Pirellulaceae bacterium]
MAFHKRVDDRQLRRRASVPSEVLHRLTTRQRDVLEAYCRILNSKRVARQLGLSRKTVNNHLTDIQRRLHCRSREELLFLVFSDQPLSTHPPKYVGNIPGTESPGSR